jgi:hypothetical protein
MIPFKNVDIKGRKESAANCRNRTVCTKILADGQNNHSKQLSHILTKAVSNSIPKKPYIRKKK